jgi:transposase
VKQPFGCAAVSSHLQGRVINPNLNYHYLITMSDPVVYLGVDVAKATLEIDGLRALRKLPNTAAGHRRLCAAMPPHAHVILEATGGYERGLVAALHAAGIALTVFNPRQIRDFARAKGLHAKTDRLDASVLTLYGECFKPNPDSVPAPAQSELAELVDRRNQLQQWKIAELNRMEHHRSARVRAQARRMLKRGEREIEQLDLWIAQTVAADEPLMAKSQRMQQVCGVGKTVAATMLADMPELGTLSRKQAAALAGVAPFNHDSGPFRGKRSVRGGRSTARSALYMASLSAVVYNPILKTFYQRLRASNKPAKVALTAVMRKLVILLNHLLKNPHFNVAT